jgi:hypothetical protein
LRYSLNKRPYYRKQASNNYSYNSYYKGAFDKIKRLQVNNISTFDKTLFTILAIIYYKRFIFLVKVYSNLLVLATLPLYIKGKATT